MASTFGTVWSATEHVVKLAIPAIKDDSAAVKRVTYNTLSYYAMNLTVLAGLVVGVAAPILRLISFTTASWWVIVPLVARRLIAQELVTLEIDSAQLKLNKKITYFAARHFGFPPQKENSCAVLRFLGIDPNVYPDWNIVVYKILGIQWRASLPFDPYTGQPLVNSSSGSGGQQQVRAH